MRWDALFNDLEGQLQESQRREWEAEVVERTRSERADVTWIDRLAASLGQRVRFRTGGGEAAGRLIEIGRDWAMVEEGTDRPAIVPHAAVLSCSGLVRRASSPDGVIARRFSLGVALRAVARDRLPVAVHDRSGGLVIGTIDVVGLDYVEVAEHPADLVRRPESITGYRVVPTGSLAVLRRAMQF